jgi:hypothetical protein
MRVGSVWGGYDRASIGFRSGTWMVGLGLRERLAFAFAWKRAKAPLLWNAIMMAVARRANHAVCRSQGAQGSSVTPRSGLADVDFGPSCHRHHKVGC